MVKKPGLLKHIIQFLYLYIYKSYILIQNRDSKISHLEVPAPDSTKHVLNLQTQFDPDSLLHDSDKVLHDQGNVLQDPDNLLHDQGNVRPR